MLNRALSYSTGWPSSIKQVSIVPLCDALIGLNTFIASIMQSVSPALTVCPTVIKGLAPGVLEKRERLEQLRALEAGMRIEAVRVDTVPLGVDTPADLERARLTLDPNR